ncbi:MAG TPA: lysylphosphatidylglycerol synthase transmembrane domain-containing protein [Cyclobacteriaceae bacterium]|nr:lysylphosphatidylglycerol synthase transmembrane domain-containing protein [Cyclobacteriaceae bacterium]
MKRSPKQYFQILFPLLLAVGIFWYLYKDLDAESLVAAVRQASFFWITLSIIISLWAYWLRAWRWKLLINASEKKNVNTLKVFWALMTGYLANLLVPRAGEVARCGVLAKTAGLQMGQLLGTVILERTVDLLFLVLMVFVAFAVEKEVFLSLLGTSGSLESVGSLFARYFPYIIGVLFLGAGLAFLIFRQYREAGLVKKLANFASDFLSGLKSIGYVNNQLGFWASSLLIWVIYFLMMYFVAIGVSSTSGLNPGSVLMVLVFGSIGMVAPVQGGIGTFHALVAFILVIYGLSETEAKIFAVIVHGTQLFTIIVLGIISILMLFKSLPKEEPIAESLR